MQGLLSALDEKSSEKKLNKYLMRSRNLRGRFVGWASMRHLNRNSLLWSSLASPSGPAVATEQRAGQAAQYRGLDAAAGATLSADIRGHYQLLAPQFSTDTRDHYQLCGLGGLETRGSSLKPTISRKPYEPLIQHHNSVADASTFYLAFLISCTTMAEEY